MKSAVFKAITCETEASVHSRKHWKQFKAVYYSGTELGLLTKSRPRELSAACTSLINAIAGVPLGALNFFLFRKMLRCNYYYIFPLMNVVHAIIAIFFFRYCSSDREIVTARFAPQT